MHSPKKILIFGATSAIAYETAKLFARAGASLYLCARSKYELERLAFDLRVRGAAEVHFAVFDGLDDHSITAAVDTCLEAFPDLDAALIAHGTLPDQRLCETDQSELRKVIEINFTSVAVILHWLALHFEERGNGTIAVISSVAGDRGRQSNYAYGAAKGGLTVFLQGLRGRLAKSNVHVLTIKPGFVDTPMTAHLPKNFLFAGPDKVAEGIYKAMHRRKEVVYLPFFWRWIMRIVKLIPERIFKKLKV